MKRMFILSILLMTTIGCGPEPEGSRGPLECTDDFDNDQDGLIDCADPDCCETENCSMAPECSTSSTSACEQFVDAAQACMDEYAAAYDLTTTTLYTAEHCADSDGSLYDYYTCAKDAYDSGDCSTIEGVMEVYDVVTACHIYEVM